jgi:hypothetical protein
MSRFLSTRHPWEIPLWLLAGVWATWSSDPLAPNQWVGTLTLTAIAVLWMHSRSSTPAAHSPPPPPTSSSAPRPLPRRLLWTVVRAAGVASILSAAATVQAWLRGSITSFRSGLSLWDIIAVYWITALLVAVLVGTLVPRTHARTWAFGLGAVLGTAFYSVATLTIPPGLPLHWWVPLIPGLAVGGGIGWINAGRWPAA